MIRPGDIVYRRVRVQHPPTGAAAGMHPDAPAVAVASSDAYQPVQVIRPGAYRDTFIVRHLLADRVEVVSSTALSANPD